MKVTLLYASYDAIGQYCLSTESRKTVIICVSESNSSIVATFCFYF